MFAPSHTNPHTRNRAAWPLLIPLLALLGTPNSASAQGAANFQLDVNTAIDDGLAYLRDQAVLTADTAEARNARPLGLLAFLQQTQAGYATLSAEDATVVREAVGRILDDGQCGVDRGFYAYCHGASVMALSLYARTGGPEVPHVAGRTLRQAIDKLVDDILAQQSQAQAGAQSGFWGYTEPGDDASTTQFAAAGLGAARGYYAPLALFGDGDATDAIVRIDTALQRTADGYERQRNADGGIGYRVDGGHDSSYQQTASGLWCQVLGGMGLNHPSVQAYLGWLHSMYNYQTIEAARNDWRQSYYYMLWSSAKAYRLLSVVGAPPDPGHITPSDLGLLPADGPRLAGRDPTVDAQPLPRGAGGVGYYAGAEAGWYYDYAYSLMSQQDADGRFVPTSGGVAHGCWNILACQAYALLVLERSLGGACVDGDGDGHCDHEDNCPQIANPDQNDEDGDLVGDACDLCPGENDADASIFDQQIVCPSICVDNLPPAPHCPEILHVPLDESCDWATTPEILTDASSDPNGHRVQCDTHHLAGHGYQSRSVTSWCQDECGLHSERGCETLIVPEDRTPPTVAVGRDLSTFALADEWAANWHSVRSLCDISWTENCGHPSSIHRGILAVYSSDPNEVIEGQPGRFVSHGIVTDWSGFMVNLDGRHADPRVYMFDYVVGDESGNWTEVSCQVEIVGGSDSACDGIDEDGDGQIDEDYLVKHIECGEGLCRRHGTAACIDGAIVEHCEPGAESPEICDRQDNDCDGIVDDGFATGLPCAVGAGLCARSGEMVCSADGHDVICGATAGAPAPEICDGADNDCDQSIDEDFVCDVQGPTVQVDLAPAVADPNQEVILTVVAQDPSGVTAVALTLDGAPTALDDQGQATFSREAPGHYPLRVEATDAAGNVTLYTDEIVVRDPADNAVPMAAMTSPLPGDLVDGDNGDNGDNGNNGNNGNDIIGTAHDDNLLEYRLSYSPAHLDGYVIFASGRAPVVDGVLGRFPADRLPANAYDLRLEVTDANGQVAMTERRVVVPPTARLGALQVCTYDLTANLAGSAVHVEHCYDSTLGTAAGAGIGWSVSTEQGHVAHSRALASGWVADRFCTREEGGACVEYGCTLTPSNDWVPATTQVYLEGSSVAADASVLGFNLEIEDLQATADGCAGRVAWRPDAHTLPTWALRSLDEDEEEVVVALSVGDSTLTQPNGSPFAPDRFALSNPAGDVWGIGPTHIEYRGDDTDKLVLELGADEISAAAGGAGVIRERGADGQITRISDPSGASVTFDYDADGHLTQVTAPNGGVSTYAYDDAHRLIAITDAVGAIRRYTYDAAGRLATVQAPDGAVTTFEYDAVDRVETQTIDGQIQHVRRFDARGRLIEQTDALGQSQQWTYDATGQLVAHVDALGRTVEAAYDAQGRRVSATTAGGGVRQVSYNDAGRVASTTDELGNTFEYVYDAAGDATGIRRPDGGDLVTVSYSDVGQPLTVTNALGEQAELGYDDAHRLASVQDPSGGTWQFTYDANGRVSTETDPQGRSSSYDYDAQGRLVGLTDPTQSTMTVEYDAQGRLVASVDRLGHRSELEYDAQNRPIARTYADGSQASVEYDARGLPVTQIDPLGRTIRNHFDDAGRLIRVEGPEGRTEHMTYDAAGQLTAYVDANGHESRVQWDAQGRIAAVVDGTGARVAVERDASGAVSGVTDAAGQTHRSIYDALGRLTATEDPAGAQRRLEYDAVGRPIAQLDEENRATSVEYDAAGRVSAVDQGGLIQASYGYDATGQLLSATNGRGHETTIELDDAGRPVRFVAPLGGSTEHLYDALGHVTATTQPSGESVTFVRDARNRITRVTASDGQIFELTYAPPADAVTVTDGRGLTTYQLDDLGRTQAVIHPDGARIDYARDGHGNIIGRTARVHPDATGHRVQYNYDAQNRLVQVIDDDLGVTRYTYDGRGLMTAADLPNGARTTWTHDAMGRVTGIVHTDGQDTVIESMAMTRDASGLLTGLETTIDGVTRTATYAYDAAARLVGEQREGDFGDGTAERTLLYAYDAASNLIEVDDSLEGVTTYTYDADNRLTADSTGAIYQWDADGRLVRQESADGVTEYGWDALGRLISVRRPDDSTSLYTYDIMGNRVATTGPDGVTIHALVDTQTTLSTVVAEYDDTGTERAVYTHGVGPIRRATAEGMDFYHSGPVGTISLLTDAAGDLDDRYVFGAFGQRLDQQGSSDSYSGFVGQPMDPTGLIYMRARYYDPALRRFISPDRWPASIDDPQALNRYLYANGDPVNLSDPSGHIVPLIVAAVSATATLVRVGMVAYRAAKIVGGVGAAITAGATGLNAAGLGNEIWEHGFGRVWDRVSDWVTGTPEAASLHGGDFTPAELCRMLTDLVAADNKAVSPVDVVWHGSDYTFFAPMQQELNFGFPSIYGNVDVDWMLKVSFYGVPRLANQASQAVLGTDTNAGGHLASSWIYYVGKSYWNYVRQYREGYSRAHWDVTSMIAEENRNAAVAAAEWSAGRKSLEEIFRPSLNMCQMYLPNGSGVAVQPQRAAICAADALMGDINQYNGCNMLDVGEYGFNGRWVYIVLQRSRNDPMNNFDGATREGNRYTIGGTDGWWGVNNCVHQRWLPFIVGGYWPSIFGKPYGCD